MNNLVGLSDMENSIIVQKKSQHMKKSQSAINLDYVDELAELSGYNNSMINDEFDNMVNDLNFRSKFEGIYNIIMSDITEINRNNEQNKQWLSNISINNICFNLGILSSMFSKKYSQNFTEILDNINNTDFKEVENNLNKIKIMVNI